VTAPIFHSRESIVKRLLIAIVASVLLAPAAFAQYASPTLAKIKTAHSITVAYSADSLPFSYKDGNNQPAGYSIEICKRVIAAIGQNVGIPDLKVNWVADTVPNRIKMIADGKADLECANASVSRSRMGSVDFSNLVFVDTGGFLVRADGPVKSATDLAGKSVAVTTGTTTERRLNTMLKDRLISAKVVPVKDAVEGAAQLESGAVAAFASDKVKLVGVMAQAKDPKAFGMLDETLSFEPYAFMLPRNDSAYRLVINTALTQVYMSGEIEGIFANSMGKLGRPSGLLAALYILSSVPE
jgi:ABC-type amino acid transport substrate-binding protein